MSAKSSGYDAEREAGAQLTIFKAVLLVMGLACILISAAFNMYLVKENAVLKNSVSEYAKVRQQVIVFREVHQVAQRIVQELKQLATTDNEVDRILKKWERPLRNYGLDRITASNIAGERGFDE